MPERHTPTNLLLLLMTFITGVALGWALHDLFQRSPVVVTKLPTVAATATTTNRPATATATMLLPTVSNVPATLVPEPTLTPTEAPATLTPVPTATMVSATEIPTQAIITGYLAHQLLAGETLAGIAAQAGSSVELIQHYNLLVGDPPIGRMLIIPQIQGQATTLEPEALLVEHGSSAHPWVALTLDAGGDSGPTPAMLDTLRDHHVHITFFLTGKWIRENPALAKRIVAEGHEIGNHTNSHPDLRQLDDPAIRNELDQAETIMQETTGVGMRPFFRPPYGAYDARVLKVVAAAGYLPVYWTLDSLDSVGEPKTAAFLLDRVTNKLPAEKLSGAIILAHCGSAPTAEALPQILDRFQAMGFEVRKLSEVLN